jgi:hypothetical protein
VLHTTRATRLFRQLRRHESQILRKELEVDADATSDDSGSLASVVAVGWGVVALVFTALALLEFALA